MGKRRQNMLEAFQASSGLPDLPPEEMPAERDDSAGGPFAPAPESSEELAPLGPIDEDALEEEFVLPVGPRAFAVLQLVLLAIVFFLGRLSAGPAPTDGGVLAGSRSESGATGSKQTELEGGTPVNVQSGRTAADEAFLDRDNKFTIRVLQYGDSERDGALAFEAYDHLRANGFEAIWPRAKGSNRYVFVGAAQRMDDLKATLARLHKTPGPGSDVGAYSNAYVVNIEDYVGASDPR